MKQIILALVVALMFLGGMASAQAPNTGETEVSAEVDVSFDLLVPDLVDLGLLAPGQTGDVHDDTGHVWCNMGWELCAQDNSADPPVVGPGNGKMTKSDGKQLSTNLRVDVKVDGGMEVEKEVPSDGSCVLMSSMSGAGQHTLETSYHQDVTWNDEPGLYKFRVTWVLSTVP